MKVELLAGIQARVSSFRLPGVRHSLTRITLQERSTRLYGYYFRRLIPNCPYPFPCRADIEYLYQLIHEPYRPIFRGLGRLANLALQRQSRSKLLLQTLSGHSFIKLQISNEQQVLYPYPRRIKRKHRIPLNVSSHTLTQQVYCL